MSYSTQQLRKTCTTHTNPGLDNPFRLMLPICHSAFHCKVNQYRTNIPFNYTGRCIPKAQRGPLQNQVAAFQHVSTLQNLFQEIFVPPPWQPPTVIDHHKTTHDQVFWRLHLSFTVISYFKTAILLTFLPKSESRLSGLSPFAVTFGYASMSMQLDLEMWGIASRVSLWCCCAVFGT